MVMNVNPPRPGVSEDKWHQLKLQMQQSFAYKDANLREGAEEHPVAFYWIPGNKQSQKIPLSFDRT